MESRVLRIALRNQIRQQIEDLCCAQGVESAGGHVRRFGQRTRSDIIFADDDCRFIRRRRSNYNHAIILALDTTGHDLAGFHFDLSRRVTLDNHF